MDVMEETGESFSTPGTWRKIDEDSFAYTQEDGFEMILKYDAEEDTLHRYWQLESADDNAASVLDFIYTRVDEAGKATAE